MLKVGQSRELQAALLSVRQADREIRSDINKDARRVLKPEWNDGLVKHSGSLLERSALVPGARLTFGRNNITAVAAASKRPLSGGLVPATDYPGIEWGSSKLRQFKARTRKGYVVGPAAGDLITRAVSVWVHTIVDKFRAHWEVKR